MLRNRVKMIVTRPRLKQTSLTCFFFHVIYLCASIYVRRMFNNYSQNTRVHVEWTKLSRKSRIILQFLH